MTLDVPDRCRSTRSIPSLFCVHVCVTVIVLQLSTLQLYCTFGLFPDVYSYSPVDSFVSYNVVWASSFFMHNTLNILWPFIRWETRDRKSLLLIVLRLNSRWLSHKERQRRVVNQSFRLSCVCLTATCWRTLKKSLHGENVSCCVLKGKVSVAAHW